MRAPIPLFALLCGPWMACRPPSMALLPSAEEKQLGRRLSEALDERKPTLSEGEVTAYVQRVGKAVANAALPDRSDVTYEFKAVDRPGTVSAFSLPGGQVYASTGLLLFAESEAELAAALAHEVGHVSARHAARQVVAVYGQTKASALALGREPKLLGDLSSEVAARCFFEPNTPAEELDADRRALVYLNRAQYDPHALASFLERLAQRAQAQPELAASYFAAHPLSPERLQRIRDQLQAMEPVGGKLDRESLEEVQKLLGRS